MEYAKDIATDVFKLTWQRADLIDALESGNEKVWQAVVATMERNAPLVEAHAKQTAPWTDRTGNARQGLRADAFQTDDNAGIILYHQVPYGIWLEVAHSGNYAVIMPTIDVMGPQVMASLERVLDKVKFT